MKPKTKSIIQFTILLGLGILLIWFALRAVASEKDKIIFAFKNADYFWVGVSTVIAFFAHFLRAYRWNYLLQPLGHKTSLFNATAAVFIGYFANYAMRLGEVLRPTIIDRYDKVPFQAGFGTVITERLIDFILLAVIFVLTLLFQFSELGGLAEKYVFSGLRVKLGFFIQNPVLGIIVVLVFLGALVGLFMLRKKIAGALKGKFGKFLLGFGEGLSSIKNVKNIPMFILLSILIWVMYFYSLYFCLKALPETAGIGQKECLTLMLFGTFGVIFTPGGLGAYHILITELLVFFGVATAPAVALPWLTWTSQLVLVTVFGLIFLGILPIVNKKKNEPAQ